MNWNSAPRLRQIGTQLSAAALAAMLLSACDSVATWMEGAAEASVRAELGPDVRLKRVRYVRAEAANRVCGMADGRRFTWEGDYTEGPGATPPVFHDGAEGEARWTALCARG